MALSRIDYQWHAEEYAKMLCNAVEPRVIRIIVNSIDRFMVRASEKNEKFNKAKYLDDIVAHVSKRDFVSRTERTFIYQAFVDVLHYRPKGLM